MVMSWFSPSLKYLVLKYLQVGVRTNPPDWFHLEFIELNPCGSPKDISFHDERREKRTNRVCELFSSCMPLFLPITLAAPLGKV